MNHAIAAAALFMAALLAAPVSAQGQAQPAAAGAPEATSPMFNKVLGIFPDPRLVVDAGTFPHVLYYETASTPQTSQAQYALRYSYLEGTILRSFRIPATGYFTTSCTLQTGTACQPHLQAARFVLDGQQRAHVVAWGSETYDHVTNTSTAALVNVTCPPGAACSTPVTVATYQGQCHAALPRGTKCPPPPKDFELQIVNDQLFLSYNDSRDVQPESASAHWVVAQRAAAGGPWMQAFDYTSTVTDTLPLGGPAD